MKQVFLSYAREDLTKVRRLYEDLSRRIPMHFWLDKHELIPGLKWDPAIRKAIRESEYFIAVLSDFGVNNKGFRDTELREAMRISKEFPEDWVFLVAARLDACRMPFKKLQELTYANLFPKWEEGVDDLCRSLLHRESKGPATRADSRAAASKNSAPAPHYRVGLVDLDGRLGAVGEIAAGLNAAQSILHFTPQSLTMPRRAGMTIDGLRQLYVPRLPKSFYSEIGPLQLDCIICMTGRYLAFDSDRGDKIEYNYYAGPSPLDPRVLFISYADLDEYAGKAGVSVPAATAVLMVGQLVSFFTDRDYHRKSRNCPMDFSKEHSKLVGAFRDGRFCGYCARVLAKSQPFDEAFKAMLAWGRRP